LIKRSVKLWLFARILTKNYIYNIFTYRPFKNWIGGSELMAIIVDKYELLFHVPNLVKVSVVLYYEILRIVRSEIGEELSKLSRHTLQRWAALEGIRLSWACKKNPELQIQVLGVCGNEVKIRIIFPLEGMSASCSSLIKKVADRYKLEGNRIESRVTVTSELGLLMSVFLFGKFRPVQVKFMGDSPSNGHGQKYFSAISELGEPWDETIYR